MNGTDKNAGTTTSGVDQLIRRVRDEGVEQARQESDRLIEEARQEAARIVSDAREEAEAMKQAAKAEIESDEKSAMAALRMAARDAVAELTSRIAIAFEEHVKRLVSSATFDQELTRTLVLLLAGKVKQEITHDKDLEIMLSEAFLEGEVKSDQALPERAKEQILSISKEMLREGVQLIPATNVSAGAKVRLVGENLEIDLTDEAISELLLRYMQPRFVAILRGAE
jgi:V/A-type H+-transporting ATPase subunit E